MFIPLMLVIFGGVFLFETIQTPDRAAATTGGLTFTKIATHPQAALQPTTLGKTLTDFSIKGNILYSGYGDYDANTGPIAINPFNLTTNTFQGVVLTVPTEEVQVIRNIGGVLYAPYTDGRVPWTSNIGYASMNTSNVWQNNDVIPGVHMYDMASLGTNLFMAGSSSTDSVHEQATIYQSTNNGATWAPIRIETSTIPNDMDRFYWIATLNGKVYTQSTTTPQKPLRIFNGTTWSTGTTQKICPGIDAALVEVFANNIACTANGSASINLYNGTTLSSTDPNVGAISDFYVASDGYFYVLGSNGIARTNSFSSWQAISGGTFTDGALAVYNDKVYISDNNANIYESNATISNAPIVTSTPSVIDAYDNATFNYYYEVGSTSSVTLSLEGSEFAQNAAVLIDGHQVTPDNITSSVITVTLSAAQLSYITETKDVSLTVTNPDGGTTTAAKGFTFFVPGPTVITGAHFQEDADGQKSLVANGINFTDASSSYYTQALTKSLLTFNGQAMPACTDGLGVTAAQLVAAGYGAQYISDSAPCYEITGANGPLITHDQIILRLSDNFDMSVPATVQVTSLGNSNVYIVSSPVVTSPVMVPLAPNTGVLPSKYDYSAIPFVMGGLIISFVSIALIKLRKMRS